MAAKFTAGQLVQVTDPRSLAYGRIAMVMSGGQTTQVKLRFADLPKMVEPTDAPPHRSHPRRDLQ